MWFRVDDKLHDHRKARKAKKAAMGVWVLAGSWCADNLTDGFVPADVLPRWGTKADAAALVAAGLWTVGTRDGERGWHFHDWGGFQPSVAVKAAMRAKESEAGTRGNHQRWHVTRGIVDENCEYCQSPDAVPDHDPDRVPDPPPDGEGESGGESGSHRPVPRPIPEPVEPDGSTRRDRPEIARICDHLADHIEANTGKRPIVGARWHDAARLLLDRDQRTVDQVIAAIDWCQTDEFWRGNILSLPKLREKYDQLRLHAQRGARPSTTQQRTDDLFDRAAQRMGIAQ